MDVGSVPQQDHPNGTKRQENITGRVKKILITFAAFTLIAAAVSRAASSAKSATRKRGRDSSYLSHLLEDCANSLKNLIPTMDSVLAYLHDDDGQRSSIEEGEQRSSRRRTGRHSTKRATRSARRRTLLEEASGPSTLGPDSRTPRSKPRPTSRVNLESALRLDSELDSDTDADSNSDSDLEEELGINSRSVPKSTANKTKATMARGKLEPKSMVHGAEADIDENATSKENTDVQAETRGETEPYVSSSSSPAGPLSLTETPSSALGPISTGSYKLAVGDKVEILMDNDESPVRATVTSDSDGQTIVALEKTSQTVNLLPKHKATVLLDGTNYGSLSIQHALDKITEACGGDSGDVNASAGDFVILAGERPDSQDRESWMGVVVSTSKTKVRVKYLRQIIDTCFDPYCKISPQDGELLFVFYEQRAFHKPWREGEVPIDSLLYANQMEEHFTKSTISSAGADGEAMTVDVFRWSPSSAL